MDMGRFLIEMHLRTGKPIKELARAHDVNPSWLFKLLRRERGPGSKTAQKRRATQQRRGAAGHEFPDQAALVSAQQSVRQIARKARVAEEEFGVPISFLAAGVTSVAA